MTRRLTPRTQGVDVSCPVCRMAFLAEKPDRKKSVPEKSDITLRASAPGSPGVNALHYAIFTCPYCAFSAFESEFDGVRINAKSARDLKAECLKAVEDAGLDGLDRFTEPRTLKHALAAYPMAELWYRDRQDVSRRLFRLGLINVHLFWLIEEAREDGLITAGDARTMRNQRALKAENFLEQSYLSEKFPDRWPFGPDPDLDFGHASLPYLISYLNFFLASFTDEGVPEKSVYLLKAEKFNLAASSQAWESKNTDLLAKSGALAGEIGKLKRELESETGPGRSANRQDGETPAEFVVQESLRWELPFEKLFEEHGQVVVDGDVIFRQGEHSYHMYFILSGMVAIQRTYTVGGVEKPRLLATLGSGSFFGEMSMIDGIERFATARAVIPTRLVKLDYKGFKKIAMAYPELSIRMIEVLIRRLRYIDLNVYQKLIETERELPAKEKGAASKPKPAARKWAADLESILADLMKVNKK